jgi:hypothetical protein
MRQELSVISAVIGLILEQSITGTDLSDTDYLLSALVAVGGSINELPCNGGIAKTKGGRQNGGSRDVLVAVVLRFWCGKSQSDAARVVCNLGGNWLESVEQSITGADLSDTIMC